MRRHATLLSPKQWRNGWRSARRPCPTPASTRRWRNAQEDEEIAARRALAREYLERDAEELIEALGEPLERNYAPSCLGAGEDGELVYEGFTVYTYREGDRETVTDVS